MVFIKSKSFIYISVLLLVFVAITGVLSPGEAQARVDRTSGSGMAEGDPGDGLDSIGGGSSPGSNSNQSISEKMPAGLDPNLRAYLPVYFPVFFEMVPYEVNGKISFVILIDTSIKGGNK